MNTIFTITPCLISIMWLVYFIINYNKQIKPNKLLVLFFSNTAILYFCHFVYFIQIEQIYSFSKYIYIFCNQAAYPLYLIYILKLCSKSTNLKPYYYLFIPAFILPITSIILKHIYISDIINSIQYSTIKALLLKCQMICFSINLTIFTVVSTHKFHIYRKEISSFYSNTTKKDLKAVNNLLYAFVCTSILSAIVNTIGKEYFFNKETYVYIMSGLFSTLIFFIGYFGAKQKFSIEQLIKDELMVDLQLNNSTDSTLNSQQIKNKILDLIIDKKIYLEPNLTIANIASLLSTNRTYISKAVNEEFSMNFNKLINTYRIEHAKKLMISFKNKPYYKIAEESGFTNEQCFYRNFKNIENITPQNWKNKQI